MPQMRTVYRNNPGKDDHGKPRTVAAVDAAEMCRGGRDYLPHDPTAVKKAAQESAQDPASGSEGSGAPGGSGTGEPGSGEGGQNPKYEDMPVRDLHPVAERLGVDGYKTMNKPALIDAIRAAEKAAAAGGSGGAD